MKRYSQLVRHEGNRCLFDIIDIAILSTYAGVPVHIHAEGLRGTGKTTIIRASRNIFPKIERIKGCEYNCDPKDPHCPNHKDLSPEEIEKIGVELIDMPFLEISHSAKKGTVVGSIDVGKLLSKNNPQAALLLGTIPRAHRGVIFIDEINRLADTSPEIVDILLDVMGTKPGRIQIEETGLPTVEIPVKVSVWAASNPDEDPGPLENIRRQLSDRFDFVVDVEKPKSIGTVLDILDGRERKENLELEREKVKKFIEAREKLAEFEVPEELKTTLASMYINYGLESIRGMESILHGIWILSALRGKKPEIKDLSYLVRVALKHRTDSKNLAEILKNLESLNTKNTETFQKPQLELPAKENFASPMQREVERNNKMNSFKKMFSAFSRAMKGKALPTVDPKNVEINAPDQKAVPLKQLDFNECVKTEDELL
ncbi:Magnesium-chelatase 38 kDa subunit [Fervidicola ferrireducens]|uniref:Magnesium-chelatase 38 kDa subunit n=1 Tax=Fervidicola ferrireducens TaxID=520764 RepID=A0A140LCD7_9FIRM|nr:magnesium chelatase [Fervidicola ferrireducens]KXG78212.1 Magnesium-chelatase 38 kDa subunit [Fervidicola ferrireducens]